MKRFILIVVSIFLCLSCRENGHHPIAPGPGTEGGSAQGGNPQPFKEMDLKTFSFKKVHNLKALYEDIVLDVSQGRAEVVSPKVTSSSLIASFDPGDSKVYVDGVEQISGVTVNDFSSPVTYEVKGERDFSFVVTVKGSGLPAVFIYTKDSQPVPSKWEPWLTGNVMTVFNTDWSVDYSGVLEIRGRGNTTWEYPKKPYALKLESKAEILGMPEHKRWVLLANWMDRTLLRNAASFRLSSLSGLAYTPRGEFVELFLNDTHMGNYYLCEQIKVDDDRVNIDELKKDEIDGGYLLELDVYYDEANRFYSEIRKLPYMFKDPDDVNGSQFKFIMDYVNDMEASLYDDARFEAGEYMEYIDLDSFVDWWLVLELAGMAEPNHPKSTYMHKDKGGRLKMGPVWDFDWGTYMVHTWFLCDKSLYYERLLQDRRFVDKVKERWGMYEDAFRTLPEHIRSEAEKIRVSESINHQMWPITQYINGDEQMSFDEAVESMITAYEKKYDWMDKKIDRM